MLQCVTVRGSVLQCVAECCSVLQLQFVAVCCSVFQCVAGVAGVVDVPTVAAALPEVRVNISTPMSCATTAASCFIVYMCVCIYIHVFMCQCMYLDNHKLCNHRRFQIN